MRTLKWIETLYLLNFALIFTHEIDSAFWKEWKLFRMPGGIQAFLAINFVLLLVALIGFREVLLGGRRCLVFSLVLAASGVGAFVIHGYFLLTGHPTFTLPASLIVLFLILVVSLVQVVVSLDKLRSGHPPRH